MTTEQPTGGAVLLDETEFDADVCDAAAKAVRAQLKRPRMIRRHDIDYEPRDTAATPDDPPVAA